MMKKIIILLVLQSVLLCTNGLAQFVNIPDANFRSWLNNNGYASCMSGNMMDTTCSLIVNATKVNCQQSNITDITGIQYFDNLDTLICGNQNLTFLPPIHASLLLLNANSCNDLASIANFPTSLLSIDINLSTNIVDLTSLPSLPAGLLRLSVNGCKLQALPTLPSTLTYLSCSLNHLYTLPALPAGLTYLDCVSDSLTSLPTLPSTLTYLNCGFNQLTNLPSLPPNLSSLYCYQNQLTFLPSLPSTITYLNIGWNSISNLPNVPSSLYSFDCRYNNFTYLPALPNTLSILNCSNNQLTALPPYSSYLKELYCENNLLTSLATGIPNLLDILSCSGNQLTTIPTLNSGLLSFDCSKNPLTAYPALPAGLSTFYCDSVMLSNLPAIPSSVDNISCKYSAVNSLPDLPDTLNFFNISYTPLTCLPYIEKISNLQWTGTNLSCLPNIVQIQSSTPSVTSLSLCQPSGNCPTYWNITGNVFKDDNANCVNDVSEDELKIIPVKLDSAGIFVQEFLTNNSGDFSFRTGFGNYTVRIDTTFLPFNVICPLSFSHSTTLSAANSFDSLVDFAMQCKPGFDLEAKSIAPNGLVRPGALRTLYSHAGFTSANYGTNCVSTATGGTVQAILSGPVSYLSPAAGAVAPTFISGDTITWNVADFTLSNPNTDFNVNILVSTTANIGDTVCVQLNVAPAVDNNPTNNTLSTCFPIVNSFDPNSKFMTPSGAVDTAQQWFNFTVYFQNVGNGPAEDIYILDSLSSNLDASSLVFLSSSHQVITQLLTGNVLRFNYPDINLPDSVNDEPGSHGYVQFKLKRKAGLPVGAIISNKAHIYFDYNPAIITNTVSATLTLPVGLNEIETDNPILIFPNPSEGNFNILFSKIIQNGRIEILNMFGEIIFESNIFNASENHIILKNISGGIYFIWVFDGEKYSCKKVILGQK
ncbi:MAG: T9SS type A sorting domain-containing protein [Bacteroidetes bacterium]|nr:T9SS type A sorting domain-containing protein [Bacteroidota bacterium]